MKLPLNYLHKPCKVQINISQYNIGIARILSTKHSFPYPKINEFISSLTAELGDYQPDVHDPDLISEFLFCPTQDERMELDTFERFKELRYDIIQ